MIAGHTRDAASKARLGVAAKGAILTYFIKHNGKLFSKMSFIDLAGSERGADVIDTGKKTKQDGAEINKSLLALKECIRALDMKSAHLPFRASKLTMVLRDSFVNQQTSKIVMIACINPGSSSADHTVNTLRYAERLKTDKAGRDVYSNPASVGYK